MNTPPWWYSGDESERIPSDDADGNERSMRIDPSGLIAAANQLVDWATERIVTPHAEHGDPSEHPTCVLCRSASVIAGLTPTAPPGAAAMGEPHAAPVRWIPCTDQRGAPWD